MPQALCIALAAAFMTVACVSTWVAVYQASVAQKARRVADEWRVAYKEARRQYREATILVRTVRFNDAAVAVRRVAYDDAGKPYLTGDEFDAIELGPICRRDKDFYYHEYLIARFIGGRWVVSR